MKDAGGVNIIRVVDSSSKYTTGVVDRRTCALPNDCFGSEEDKPMQTHAALHAFDRTASGLTGTLVSLRSSAPGQRGVNPRKANERKDLGVPQP